MKRNKGITLIALVITIIILIILAGIAINAVFGENGLILRAQEAKFKTEVSNIRDIVEMKRIQIGPNGEIILNKMNLESIDDISIAQKNKYITGGKKLVISGNKLCYYNEEEDSEFSRIEKDWLKQIGIGPAGEEEEEEDVPAIVNEVLFDMSIASEPVHFGYKINDLSVQGEYTGSYAVTFHGLINLSYSFITMYQGFLNNLIQIIENNPGDLLQNIYEVSDISFSTITELKTYMFNDSNVTNIQLAKGLILNLMKLENEFEEINTWSDLMNLMTDEEVSEEFGGIENSTVYALLLVSGYQVKITKPDMDFEIISLQDIPGYPSFTNYKLWFEIYSNGLYSFQLIPPETTCYWERLSDSQLWILHIILGNKDTATINVTDFPGGDTGNYNVTYHY